MSRLSTFKAGSRVPIVPFLEALRFLRVRIGDPSGPSGLVVQAEHLEFGVDTQALCHRLHALELLEHEGEKSCLCYPHPRCKSVATSTLAALPGIEKLWATMALLWHVL